MPVNGTAWARAANESKWATSGAGDGKSETKDNWCTPGPVVELLYRFGGRPALDPCSNPNSIVGAVIEWYGPHVGGTDGLVMPWVVDGYVFDNPPYSAKEIWMAKVDLEARQGVEVLSLLPADTDTNWFQTYGVPSDEKCFFKGRLGFIGDRESSARHPSVMFYHGERGAWFREVFGQAGWCP